jgi:hypothetical protein
MTCNKKYVVTGTLKPRQRVGSHLVSIKAYYYEGGSWTLRKTVSTSAIKYKSYSKYRGKIALDRSGRWQLRAAIPDGPLYAATESGSKSVSVPRQKASKIKAWVSDSSPDQYDNVTAYAKVLDPYGKPIPGAKVVFTWHYKTSTPSESSYTDSTGVATCERWISSAKAGYRVKITVKGSSGGKTAKGSTGFTPQ